MTPSSSQTHPRSGRAKLDQGQLVARAFRQVRLEIDTSLPLSQVWLRYELFCGTLGHDAFETSQRDFVDFMEPQSVERP
jgi:hypothetical protein